MNDRPSSALGASLIVFALSACSTGDQSPDDADDVIGIDATDGAIGVDGDDGGDGTGDDGEDGEDGAAEPDGTGDDGPSTDDLLDFGEPCLADSECAGALCLRIQAGLDEGFCSGYCVDADNCPPDTWDCIFLQNSGGDAAFVCVPDDLCIDGDDDHFGIGPGCDGPDCDDDDDRVFLGADETCDGLDNDCDGNIDDNPLDANVECNTGFPGVCTEGRAFCVGGLVDCVPQRPSGEEVCDLLDNDCDGLVDEGEDGEPLQESCYGGAPETVGVGQCAPGARVCLDGETTACVGQVLPFPEFCDGFDNDCDGEADEGDPGSGVVCDTELDGVCAAGVTRCDEGVISCVQQREAEEETCDGLDNDCDGEIDEGEDGELLTRTCYTGEPDTEDVGTCHAGTETCTDGEFGRCDGEVVPSIELCSTQDENCNGEINDGNPASGFLCETGDLGLCAFGRTECDAGEGGAECLPDFEPEPEICDGFDNDCDGDVDEAEDGGPLIRPCYDGPPDTIGTGVCEGGTQTCAFGDWGGCIGQRLPGVEICDGLDNDCNDAPDDGDPGGGIPCTTGDPGVCNVGITRCTDAAPRCVSTETTSDEVCDGLDNDCDGDTDEGSAWVSLGAVCFVGDGTCRKAGVFICDADDSDGPPVCSVTPGDPDPEICDGLDNDCDGDTDEPFPSLGDTCFSGLGICRAAGVVVCDGPDGTLCDAVAGTPDSDDELECDYIDDDCDGSVDEDFRTDGVYGGVEHCGGCGVACAELWDGGPAAFQVVPVCDVVFGIASCDYECEDGWHDLDADPSNGCEFTPDESAVYVATAANGGVDSGSCGAWDAPCRTIGHAITDRADPASRPRVRVSDGSFRENVTLRNGVSVLGGHNSLNWVRSPAVSVTAITGLNTATDNAAVTAIDINAPTELSGFTINAAPGRTGGGNSYGVYVRDGDDDLVIRDNAIFANSGGDGGAGDAGASGDNGVTGSRGGDSELRGSCTGSIDGGAPGPNSCTNPGGGGSATTSGGTGGSSTCPVFGEQNGSGAAGSGPAPGSGGTGGFNMLGAGTSCFVDGSIDPTPGSPGSPGVDGPGGSGATSALGAVSATRWAGAAGAEGSAGAHGSGGGGGGSAAGVETDGSDYFGATGGGGGSGGCAAWGGAAGVAGGGSFAIFVTFSATPASAADMPVLEDNELTRGQGGRGGSGGNGGAGGEPGAGASGGDGVNTGSFGFCMLAGAVGAEGGRGGHGGGGGGGAGGVSFDVYVWNSGGHDPGYGGNTFALAGGTDTGGDGGDGGTSNNTENVGTAGVSGDSGNVQLAAP